MITTYKLRGYHLTMKIKYDINYKSINRHCLKENRYFESRILVVLLCLVIGYIVTNFIYEFL